MMRPLSVSKLPLGKLSGQSHCIKERTRKQIFRGVIFLGGWFCGSHSWGADRYGETTRLNRGIMPPLKLGTIRSYIRYVTERPMLHTRSPIWCFRLDSAWNCMHYYTVYSEQFHFFSHANSDSVNQHCVHSVPDQGQELKGLRRQSHRPHTTRGPPQSID